ncbi:DsbA family protein [Mycolicibacterium sediminis]|uniref:Protein disulfide-isomerase n=1 Tax=Mycolicibacterium sediminis TaxID=1286180 RepID=A0A7I7QQA9_9MYCO|nr:thioredoxin domain-containing protein [Mycolicibacterium sediminis]BBY28036.1 protein disulfide-isomerase [Mycolicibacterium sediminis]
MRRMGVLVALATSAFLVVGCAKEVTGVAQPDPAKPPVSITEDGNGIRAGFEDVPVEVEIYTEPQCSHCADLQRDFGDDLATFIATGQIAVTYRPLTFFDSQPDGYSARVVNAMFEAASPADGDGPATTGPEFQRFVEELWANQEPGGEGPTAEEMAEMARSAGIPEGQAGRIAKGEMGFDAAGASEINYEYLYEIDPIDTGTPTIYDLLADEKLDVYDNDWLSKLTSS